MIAHYELYKRCAPLPGCVVEFGVYKGNSLLQLATFSQMLEMSGSRKIYGFDAFGEFPVNDIKSEADQKFIAAFTQEGGEGTEHSDLQALLDAKGFGNVHLIEGDVRKTFPGFLEHNPQIRFNFVHLDMDVYEPTTFVLPEVFARMVRGGIVMIDDYNAVEGATRAIDEFLSEYPALRLEKLTSCHVPSFFVKI